MKKTSEKQFDKEKTGKINSCILYLFHCSAIRTPQEAPDRRPRFCFPNVEGCSESLGREGEKSTESKARGQTGAQI